MTARRFGSSKTWGHDVGLSACFRQWRAPSHCHLLHGYALAVRVEFESATLDERNWVVDFGGLKSFKAWLVATFDHRLLVAADDPMLAHLLDLEGLGLASVVVVPSTGCEAFAAMIFDRAEAWLREQGLADRVVVSLVEVREHGANAATVRAAA